MSDEKVQKHADPVLPASRFTPEEHVRNLKMRTARRKVIRNQNARNKLK